MKDKLDVKKNLAKIKQIHFISKRRYLFLNILTCLPSGRICEKEYIHVKKYR